MSSKIPQDQKLAERQAKLNVTLELSCVKAVPSLSVRLVELEQSEFYRALGEGCV